VIQNIFNYSLMGFGASLRARRKAARLTQQQLADKVTSRGYRITGAYISMIEREYDKTRSGEPTRVNRDFVKIAAPLLGWSTDEALMEAGYASSIQKPRTLGELITALENLGLPVPELFGGWQLDEDGEGFEEALERIYLDLQLVMKRLNQGRQRPEIEIIEGDVVDELPGTGEPASHRNTN
jgi:transcriptional regulator with XRE-family HTH domain